jgi:hypothetical protein
VLEALRELFVKLGLDFDKAGFAEAEVAVDALEKGLDLLVEGVEKVAEAFVEAVKSTAEYSEHIADAAIKTGLSTDTIQQWGAAVEVTGGSAESLTHALGALSMQMVEAKNGSSEAMLTFAQAGVKIFDTATGKLRPVEAVMLDLAEAMHKLGLGAEQIALSRKVLSRSGQELLPFFSKGKEGIQELLDSENDLVQFTDSETIESQKEFAESLTQVRQTISGLIRELAGPVIEALAPVVRQVLEWVKANRALISSKILAFAGAVVTIGRGIIAVFTAIGKAAAFVAENWKLLALIAGAALLAKFVLLNAALFEQIVFFALDSAAAIAYGAITIATAAKAAAAWLASIAPLVLVTAALVLLGLAADDLRGFLEGDDSAMGDLGKKWSDFIDKWTRSPSDNWLESFLKKALAVATDLEGTLQRIGKFFGVNISHESIAATLAGKEGSGFSHNMVRAYLAPLTGGLSAIPGIDPLKQMFDDTTLDPQHWLGGASSPAAAAASSSTSRGPLPGLGGDTYHVNVPIQVVGQPGQSPGDIADATGKAAEEAMDRWWDRKLGESAAGVGGG